jgi:hypothetical protein
VTRTAGIHKPWEKTPWDAVLAALEKKEKENHMKTSIAMLAIAGLAGTAAAQSYNGAGFTIPDNASAGASSSIVIADAGSVLDLTVTLSGLTHTWVGDLIITLSNGSSTIDLINQPGGSGGIGFGFSWNLGGDYTFDDAASATFEGFTGPSSAILPSGSYAPEGALSSFNGGSIAGTWTLSISDNAGGDTGAFQGWTLTNVPAPSAVALLGLGGVVAGRRRRA